MSYENPPPSSDRRRHRHGKRPGRTALCGTAAVLAAFASIGPAAGQISVTARRPGLSVGAAVSIVDMSKLDSVGCAGIPDCDVDDHNVGVTVDGEWYPSRWVMFGASAGYHTGGVTQRLDPDLINQVDVRVARALLYGGPRIQIARPLSLRAYTGMSFLWNSGDISTTRGGAIVTGSRNQGGLRWIVGAGIDYRFAGPVALQWNVRYTRGDSGDADTNVQYGGGFRVYF